MAADWRGWRLLVVNNQRFRWRAVIDPLPAGRVGGGSAWGFTIHDLSENRAHRIHLFGREVSLGFVSLSRPKEVVNLSNAGRVVLNADNPLLNILSDNVSAQTDLDTGVR